ncbi:hypothetical protein BV25DRAFT_1912154 [Artomyces pyxidatus]|uniref:Uncharacterized protein n=1 Tax=Artomyces pyxidatus TaxID=48021 RepID=A0ACB8TEE2_9AGAM|nr:hypothetical protein BV25DRAFT_1912154 [Artomyces pyxidatus]
MFSRVRVYRPVISLTPPKSILPISEKTSIHWRAGAKRALDLCTHKLTGATVVARHRREIVPVGGDSDQQGDDAHISNREIVISHEAQTTMSVVTCVREIAPAGVVLHARVNTATAPAGGNQDLKANLEISISL